MPHRFFADTPVSASSIRLPPKEAHHLIHVLRGQVGDEVIIFDGSGVEFQARVAEIRRSEVELQVLGRQTVDRELPLHITLGVALPKGDRQRWLIEKAVELGVGNVVPLQTERGVAQPAPKAVERLARFVIEASKQCGRNRLMQVDSARPLVDYLAQASPGAARWLAHPGTGPAFSSGQSHAASEILLAVGPEGGFTDLEVEQAARSGWQIVALGPRILRVETAALLLSALAGTGRPLPEGPRR